MIRRVLALLAISMALIGCGSLVGATIRALAVGAQSAAAIGNVLDLAKTGADIYFARHPSPESHTVTTTIQSVRGTLARYSAAVRAGEDVEQAATALRQEYTSLRAMLEALGVLDARPPHGGAETDAPLPQPLAMPEIVLLL